MEITGKIIAVLPERGGVSQRTGSEWKVQEYVLETQEQYPRKMCFDVFGADKIAQFAIKIGDQLTVSFDIDAREYQGRWYNSIRAWKVERAATAADAPVGQVPFRRFRMRHLSISRQEIPRMTCLSDRSVGMHMVNPGSEWLSGFFVR